MNALRDKLLKTFKERFYFFIDGKTVYESPICGDVHEAVAHWLRTAALEIDTHSRLDLIHILASVSLDPDGPWTRVTVSEGWRQCEPLVQDIVARVVAKQLGDDFSMELLTQADCGLLERTGR